MARAEAALTGYRGVRLVSTQKAAATAACFKTKGRVSRHLSNEVNGTVTAAAPG